MSKNLLKLQASALPTQLPARADKPSCTGMHVMFHTKYNYFVNNASKISIPRFCFFPFFLLSPRCYRSHVNMEHNPSFDVPKKLPFGDAYYWS